MFGQEEEDEITFDDYVEHGEEADVDAVSKQCYMLCFFIMSYKQVGLAPKVSL